MNSTKATEAIPIDYIPPREGVQLWRVNGGTGHAQITQNLPLTLLLVPSSHSCGQCASVFAQFSRPWGKIITFASRKPQASLLGEFAIVYNIEYSLEKKINAFLLTFFCCSQYPRAFHATKLYPKRISGVDERRPNHPSTRCACDVKWIEMTQRHPTERNSVM